MAIENHKIDDSAFGIYAPIVNENVRTSDVNSYKTIRSYYKRHGIKTTDLDRVYETNCKAFKRREFIMPPGIYEWSGIRDTMEAKICLAMTFCKNYIAVIGEEINKMGFPKGSDAWIENLEANSESNEAMQMAIKDGSMASKCVDFAWDRWPVMVANKQFVEIIMHTDIPSDFSFGDLKAPYPGMLIVFPKDLLKIAGPNGELWFKTNATDVKPGDNNSDEIDEIKVHISSVLIYFDFDNDDGGMIIGVIIMSDTGFMAPLEIKSDKNDSLLDVIDRYGGINDPVGEQLHFWFALLLFFMAEPDEVRPYESKRITKDRIRIEGKNEKIEIWNPKILGSKMDIDYNRECKIDVDTIRRKRPHWRRGHFRRARDSTKLIWIKPIFVNRHLL